MATVRYSFLDGLRAIAILMVVLVHVSQRVTIGPIEFRMTSMGQYGVQLFFVISSITVYLTLGRFGASWLERSLWIGARFAKIFPLYLYGIIVYTMFRVFAIYFGLAEQVTSIGFNEIILNALLIHGFFPSANNSVVPGGWSIGVEVIVYLVAFAFLYHFSSMKILLLGLAVFFANLFFVWSGLYIVENNRFTYYSPLNQLPVFIISWLLIKIGYIEFKDKKNIESKLYLDFFVIALFCMLAAACLMFGDYTHNLTPVVAGAFFIIFIRFVRHSESLQRLFSIPRLCFIGRISYSLYINHFIVLWVCVYVLRILGVSLVGLGWLFALYVMVFVGSLLVSVITYKYIECLFCGLYKRFLHSKI